MTSDAHDTLTGGGDSIARLRMLFDVALDVPPELRPAWIAQNVAEAGDRETLARLLAAADEIGGGFLDTPVGEHASALVADSILAESLVGQRIGAFRLVRLLGKGGMAAVFLATREGRDFRQDVAIKLLRRGLYSEIEQRLFQRERRVLASLNHPNIARLIDGGLTDAGVPYLVMEYVDGEPITRHADARALGLRGRLGLFLTVCRAVEAAHRALIVHRDIKPSNILVTGEGAVKLLDFGIAKLLEDNVEGATVGVFTPDYAAPEQVAGKAVTTATDVYALGVLLHELLLGVRPGKTPRRPSALADANGETSLHRRLRGDLDNIILKALDPESDRRYASAGALAEDIERHLAGLPVAAHPPSRWYRTRKFVTRHKGGVLTTAAFLVAILASLGIALWQTGVARRQATVAREEAARADATRRFLVGVFDQAEPDAHLGKPITAKQLLDQGEQQLAGGGDLSTDTRLDLTVLIAHLYWDLGDYAHAEPLIHQALQTLAGASVPDHVKARTLATIAGVEAQKRKFPEALGHAHQAIAIAARTGHAADEAASDARRVVAISLHGQDNSKEAEPFLRAALATDRAQFGDRSEQVLADWIELGDELTELSRFDDATVALRNAVELARALHGAVHSTVATALQELAAAYGYAARFDDAERAQREALAIFAKVYGDEHHETMVARGNLMWALEMGGSHEEALAGRLEMAKIMERTTSARPELAASNYTSIGIDNSKLGRLEDAESALRRALAIWVTIEGSNDEWDSADPMRQLADVLLWQGRYAGAEAELRHAVAIEAKHEPASSGWLNRDRAALGDMLRYQHRYAEALAEIRAAVAARGDVKPDPIQCMMLARESVAELESGDATHALAHGEAAATMAESLFPARHPNLATPKLVLARAALANGDAKRAEPLLREVLALRSPPLPASDLRVVEVKARLAIALDQLGRGDEAQALRAEIEAPLKKSRSPYAADLVAALGAKTPRAAPPSSH